MPVFVHSRVRCVVIKETIVQRLIHQLLELICQPRSEVSIEFVGDARMRRLNREFRGENGSTDVLAFACREAGGPPTPMLGDVVVSIPMARRQAKQLGHSLSEELARLLIHGVLHLTGYDHEKSKKEAKRMCSKEKELLNSLSPLPKIVMRM